MKLFFKQSFSLVFVTTLILGAGCTKEVDNWIDETIYDTISTLSDARILSYAVANAAGEDEPIYSAINNKEKTITVYLPHYYALEIMDAEIVLPEGTIINPADEYVPVFSEEQFTYEVTAKNGEKNTYTVHTVIQQPDLFVSEVSSATRTTTFSPTITSYMALRGENMVPSTSVTSLWVLDGEGNDVYKVPFNSSAVLQMDSRNMEFAFNFSNEEKALFQNDTDYWLELRSYSLSYRLTYPIRYRNY